MKREPKTLGSRLRRALQLLLRLPAYASRATKVYVLDGEGRTEEAIAMLRSAAEIWGEPLPSAHLPVELNVYAARLLPHSPEKLAAADVVLNQLAQGRKLKRYTIDDAGYLKFVALWYTSYARRTGPAAEAAEEQRLADAWKRFEPVMVNKHLEGKFPIIYKPEDFAKPALSAVRETQRAGYTRKI